MKHILLLVFLAFISIILSLAIFVLSIIVVYLWWYLVYKFICLYIILVSSFKVKYRMLMIYMNQKKHSCISRAVDFINWSVDEVHKFLWYFLAPLIFILYILCLFFHSDKSETIWILIFQITPIVD